MDIHQAQERDCNQKGVTERTMTGGAGGVGSGRMMDTCNEWREEGGIPDVVLLLPGEFQSVAEDLDSRLFITESTCLGRLTVDTEHLPIGSQKSATQMFTQVTWLRGRGGPSVASRFMLNDASTNTHPLIVWAVTRMYLKYGQTPLKQILPLLQSTYTHTAHLFNQPLGV